MVTGELRPVSSKGGRRRGELGWKWSGREEGEPCLRGRLFKGGRPQHEEEKGKKATSANRTAGEQAVTAETREENHAAVRLTGLPQQPWLLVTQDAC